MCRLIEVLFNPIECSCSESPERLKVGQEKPAWTATASHRRQTHFRSSARGTQSLHWYSRIWPTDNSHVTEVKTAGSRQIIPGRKARGSPVPLTHLHSVVMVIKQSSTTMSHSCGHILSVFLCVLSFVLRTCFFTKEDEKELTAFILKPGTTSPEMCV